MLGDTSTRSVLLSSAPGFAFAVAFFLVRTKVAHGGAESIVPLTIAAAVATAAQQHLLHRYGPPGFEFGFLAGCVVGSVVASKLF